LIGTSPDALGLFAVHAHPHQAAWGKRRKKERQIKKQKNN